jgi:predicted MFS family arabinose efflux permease
MVVRTRPVLLGYSLLLTLFLSGGVILGFAPLHRVLMDEGRFAETQLQTLFVAGFAGLSAGSVGFGLLLDAAGARSAVTLGLGVVAWPIKCI